MRMGLLLQSLSQIYWTATQQKAGAPLCRECTLKCAHCEIGKRAHIVSHMYKTIAQCKPRDFIKYVESIQHTGEPECQSALSSVLHELCLKMEVKDYEELVDRYLATE